MKPHHAILEVLIFLTSMGSAWAQPAATNYDGWWLVTQVCPAHEQAKGYTIWYEMTISGGFARGGRGVEGQPDSMTLTGQILTDGTGTLVANGLTGMAAYAARNMPEGTPFGFTLPVRFEATRGTAERTMVRPCTFNFVKLMGPLSKVAEGGYDGRWSVTQECPAHEKARAYTSRYGMTVTGGFARAERGTEGQPEFLALSGQIIGDGTATLVAAGLTGQPNTTVGNVQPGTSYGFTVPARFDATRGVGIRLTGRLCTFNFAKQ